MTQPQHRSSFNLSQAPGSLLPDSSMGRRKNYIPFLIALVAACFLAGIAIGYAVGF